MVNYLYNIVDQIFVGQGVGISGMTATNVAFPLMILVNSVALLLGDGCAANMSLCLGRRQQEAARARRFPMRLRSLSGADCCVPWPAEFLHRSLWCFAETTETAYDQAVSYLRAVSWGIPFQLMCPAFTAIIRADGAPQYTMKCMILGAVINLVLDPIFIFLFNMGVLGAGIATAIGQAAAGIMCLVYLRNMRTVKIRRKSLRPTLALTWRILCLGFPSLLTQSMTALVQITLNNLMRKYGAVSIYGSDIALSVYGMMVKVYQIAHSMFVGVSSAVQPINGLNFGAKHYDRVHETYSLAVRVSLGISVVWFLVFMLLPRQIASLFVSDSELYRDCTAHIFRIYMMAFFVYGFHMTTASFFQGIGKPVRSLLIPLVRQGVFLIPLALLLSNRYGLDGALYAVPIADVLVFLLSVLLVLCEFRSWRRSGWL